MDSDNDKTRAAKTQLKRLGFALLGLAVSVAM
jgi:hypothetical protein